PIRSTWMFMAEDPERLYRGRVISRSLHSNPMHGAPRVSSFSYRTIDPRENMAPNKPFPCTNEMTTLDLILIRETLWQPENTCALKISLEKFQSLDLARAQAGCAKLCRDPTFSM